MSEMTPAEKSLRASIAAHHKWAQTDPVEGTRKAREAFLDRFDRQADPDGTLPAAERNRRAAHLRSAHFKALALKSAEARRRKAS